MCESSSSSDSSFGEDSLTDSSSDSERSEINNIVHQVKRKFSKKLKLETVGDSTEREAILKIFAGMDVSKYQPQIIPQLIKFIRSYISDVLNEAQSFSDNTNKDSIDIEDLRATLELRNENLSIPNNIPINNIKAINGIALPDIKSKFGISLPGIYSTLMRPNLMHVAHQNEVIQNDEEMKANEIPSPNTNVKALPKILHENSNKNKQLKKKQPVFQNSEPVEDVNNKIKVPRKKIEKNNNTRSHSESPPKPPTKKRRIK